jgi:hypothetical protein
MLNTMHDLDAEKERNRHFEAMADKMIWKSNADPDGEFVKIPRTVLDKLGLHEGDRLTIAIDGESIVLSKVKK